jgi:5'-3' exoribonuclease 1
VDVEFQVYPPEAPFGHLIAESIGEDYFSSRDVCRSLGISPSVFGKIVGMILVEPGRMDFGLNLKRNGQYQLLGYVRAANADQALTQAVAAGSGAAAGPWGRGDTVKVVGSADTAELLAKKAEAEVSQWEYSARAVALLFEYKTRFPLLFDNLEVLPHQKRYGAAELLLPSTALKGHVAPQALATAAATTAAALVDWMKAQPFFSMPRTPLTTLSLSREAMRAIERAGDVRTSFLAAAGPKLTVVKKVPVECLYQGNIHTPR